MPQPPLADIAHTIQLSVAPVFLLTAVGTILSVLSTRLGRIVDRSRVLRDRLESLAPEKRPQVEEEIARLRRRRHLINTAITCGTCAALAVAAVIASAFLGFLLEWTVSWAIALLFLVAMGFMVGALVLFLREVLAAASQRSEH